MKCMTAGYEYLAMFVSMFVFVGAGYVQFLQGDIF